MNSISKLLSPFTFRNGTTVKNRLGVAPMTNTQSQSDGSLGGDEFDWLEQLASGQFGLVMTCVSHVCKTGQAWVGQLGIYDDSYIPGLKKIADMFKAHNTVGLVQLFHGRSRCPQRITGVQPCSASEFHLPIPGFEVPRPLTIAEIDKIIQAFADAAERADKAGFAGVELHGANGYLLTQFISTTTNLRTDEYGGALTGRAKLIVDIVHACRERVSKNFIIGMWLSPVGGGLDINETIQIAKWLSGAGADFIDLLLGGVMTPLPNAQQAKEPLVSYVRKALGDEITLISGGVIHTPQQAEAVLKLGIDCVTLGRIAIGNPSWPQLAIDNAP